MANRGFPHSAQGAIANRGFPRTDWGRFGLTGHSLIQVKDALGNRGFFHSGQGAIGNRGIPPSRPTVLRATWDSNIQTHGAIATHRFPHSDQGAISHLGFHLFSEWLGYARRYGNYQITWLNCYHNTRIKKTCLSLEASAFLA